MICAWSTIQAAAQVSPDAKHSFTTVQLPANLYETEGLKHTVPWAHSHGLEVLINRPINALTAGKSARLAEYADHTVQLKEAYDDAMAYATERGWDGLAAALERIEREKDEIRDVFHYEAMAGSRFVKAIQNQIDHLDGACDDACVQKLRVSFHSQRRSRMMIPFIHSTILVAAGASNNGGTMPVFDLI